MANEIVKQEDGTIGSRGERLLARGERAALRVWEHEPAGEEAPEHRNEYEVVAYVVSGRVEVRIGDAEAEELGPGDSWVVPAGTPYAFRVLDAVTVVEAVAPADAI